MVTVWCVFSGWCGCIDGHFFVGAPSVTLLGPTPLAPGQAPTSNEQRNLITAGTQKGGGPEALLPQSAGEGLGLQK